MTKPARMVVLYGLVLSLLVVFWLVGQRSRSSSRLQKYKAELIAKGEKLTFAALTKSRSTNSNGSLQALTNAAAAIRSRSSGSGPTPSALTLRDYVGPGLARPVWRADAPGGLGAGPAGRPLTWADLASEIHGIDPAFDALREALKDPDASTGPILQIWGGPRLDFVALRVTAQWLMGAALMEVHQGHLEDALQNLEALIGMARLERDDYTMVSQMIRLAIGTLGTTTTWELLQAPGWSGAQLERMQSAWERVNLLETVGKGFLAERAFGEEFWNQARSPTNRGIWQGIGARKPGKAGFETLISDYVVFPLYKLTSLDNDELFHLRTMQESIAAWRLLEEHHPWEQTRQALSAAFGRVNQISSSPQRFRYMLSLLMIPNFTRAAQNAVRAETERQLTVTALAVSRFKMRHGKYPSTLKDLVPELLAAEPWDPMSGKALGYRLKADGEFVLYSVGEDGIDNGGDATPAPPKRPGLWEGLDAVWPAAAPSQ